MTKQPHLPGLLPLIALGLGASVSGFALNSCYHPPVVPEKPSPAGLALQLRSHTVRITTLCEEGQSQGTGTVLRDGRVLTAAHVTLCGDHNDEPPIAVLLETLPTPGKVTQTRRLEAQETLKNAAGEKLDAAVVTLSAPFQGVEGAVIADDETRFGDFITFSAAVPFSTVTDARVQYDPSIFAEDNPNAVRIDQPVYPGNSGSGVFNDRGQLVGVISTRIPCDGFVVPQTCAGTYVRVLGSYLPGDNTQLAARNCPHKYCRPNLL